MVRPLLNLLGPGACFESASLRGRSPHLLFTILRPRATGLLDKDDPGDFQDVVAIEYLIVGTTARSDGWSRGLWTMEVPDHALHRIFHREPRADLTQILLDGHRNALALRVEQVRPYAKQVFWLKAGNGVFAALLWDNGSGQLYLRPETWIADDGLYSNRTVLAPDAEPGERMGDRLLMPSALRPE